MEERTCRKYVNDYNVTHAAGCVSVGTCCFLLLFVPTINLVDFLRSVQKISVHWCRETAYISILGGAFRRKKKLYASEHRLEVKLFPKIRFVFFPFKLHYKV